MRAEKARSIRNLALPLARRLPGHRHLATAGEPREGFKRLRADLGPVLGGEVWAGPRTALGMHLTVTIPYTVDGWGRHEHERQERYAI
jgi:hypothetical protein